MGSVEIRDERLCLRRLRNSEARLLMEAVRESQRELFRYLPWATPDYNMIAARAFMDYSYEEERLDRGYHLSIFDADGRRLLGGIGLMLRPLLQHGEIGYWMRAGSTGRGLATHASRMIMDWGFRTFDLRRITLTCDVTNAASSRIAEKLGMRQEGVMREYLVTAEGAGDHYLYAILDHEHRALREAESG